MSEDLQDGTVDVKRTSLSLDDLVIHGAHSYDGTVTPNTNKMVQYDIPNDGYRYVLESASMYLDGTFPYYSWVDYCLDVASPVYFDISESIGEMVHWHELSRLKAISLAYPARYRLCLYNPRAFSMYYWVAIMYYRYKVE